MPKLRFVVPTVAVILLTAALGIAIAHDYRAESAVTIRYAEQKTQFHGRVGGTRPKCEEGRSVVVQRVAQRRDPIVGADRTNENGFYKVSKRNPEGEFYAHVVRRVKGPGRHRHVCKGATSDTITVP